MKLFKLNAKKLFVLLLAFFASFALIACGDDETDKILDEALGSITLGDVSTLNADFDISNFTNKHDLEITWELVDADDTLDLVKKNDQWTTVKVTPSEYSEDANGNQNNPWGQGVLKATVEYNGKSKSREWTLHVVPGTKVEEFSLKDAKAAEDGTGVEVTGTVVLVTSNAFIIHDGTDGIVVFMGSAPAEDIKPGAEVLVKAEKGTYFGQPQLGTTSNKPIVEVTKEAPAAGYDFSNVEEVAIKELNEATTENLDSFFRIVKITGQVLKDYISPANGQKAGDYAIKDVLTNEVAVLSTSIAQSVKDALSTKVGEYVSIVIVTYEYHTQYQLWRHFGVPGTVEDAEEPTLSDEDIMESVKAQIADMFKNTEVYADLDLITEGDAGGTIVWSSNKPEVIDNDGKFTTPDEDTEVELTYTITVGELEETLKVTVTALALQVSTVLEAIEALDEKDTLVKIRGTIIGRDADDYYYLADDTGVVYVRQKLADDDLKVGDKVEVIATGTVYNVRSSGNPNQYIRQVAGNYKVTKVDDVPTPIAVVDVSITDFDNTITAAEMTTKVPQEELFAKVVRFTDVYVVVKGNYSNAYLATEPNADAPSILVYHRSINDAKLKELEGKKVTVIAVVNGYHATDGWRISFMDRDGDLTFELTEQEQLDFAKDEIEKIVSDDKEIVGNLEFITESKFNAIKGAKYVWTTDNTDVIANDGKFTAPDEDTDVEVTVKVFLDGNTEGTPSATWTYTVTAKARTGEDTLTHNFDFGESEQTGYNEGQDKEVKVTNAVDNSEFTFKANTVQIATSKNAPHADTGAFLVMAVNRNNDKAPGYSFFEFDLAGMDIVKVEFDYSWWSSADSNNKADIEVLELQVWDENTEEWVTAESFLEDVDATKYQTLSHETGAGTKFRIFGAVKGGSSNKNIRIAIDNIKFYS